MKTYKAKSGPFDERVFYEHAEMESICLDALVSAELLPDKPSPIRIDRFLKKHFGIDAEYDDIGDGNLGYTEFGKNGVERIVISTALDSEGSAQSERRIHTTMAHEAGHGLFHSHLFVFKGEGLFGDIRETPKVLCRNELRDMIENGTNKFYDGAWWEWQANVAIGALLLPKPLAEECVEPFLKDSEAFVKVLDESKRQEAYRHLAETFDVNPVVARIRLSEICPMVTSHQQTF